MTDKVFLDDRGRFQKKSVESNKRPRFEHYNGSWVFYSTGSTNLSGDTNTVALSLLQRVAVGDNEAMVECLQSYGGLVWKIVSGRCKNRSDAEDIVQEVFLDLWKSSQRFDPSVASETTFIAMLARRRVIDQHRKSQRSLATSPLSEANEQGHDSVDFIEISDEASRAREMMGQLKSEERAVIELAVDEGLSQTQISNRIDLPLGTVKTHARRGLQRLRSLLGDTMTEKGGAQ